MKRVGKVIVWILLGLLGLVGAIWLFAPREPANLRATFDPRKFGEGVQVYFESVESAFDDITPGVEKRVVWAEGFRERKTPFSVVYLHGFSATSEEIRPVPDRIAEALGANLVFTRLTGHGRSDAAMGEATVADWMVDAAEALAAGRAVGDRVIVISTSTGGTLAAAAALDSELSRDVAAMIFVSPNFGVNSALAGVLTLPGIRFWGPVLLGKWREFTPRNDRQAIYWTTLHPSVAVVPMAALVKAVVALDFSAATVPALFRFSDDDKVVNPARTRKVAESWGGPATVQTVALGPEDDAYAHVIAGDIVSPGQTEAAVTGMLDWLADLGIRR
ncbi:MAG: alpha/beta hydrolase [Marinibacterium sp.]